MELIDTLKGQALRFGTPRTPDGAGIFLPDLVGKLKAEFRFVGGPEKPGDYDLNGGIALTYGTFGGGILRTLKVYRDGMLMEGHVSTDILDLALDRAEALIGELGARIERMGPVQRLYTSQLEVRPSIAAVSALDELDAARGRLRDLVSGYGVDVGEYKVVGFTLAADPELSSTAAKPQKFLFERRTERLFSDNVFFSDAPLPTAQHFSFLNELEATLTSA